MIPGSRTNIDHLAVTPTGVYVIDAKKYRGRPHLKVEGGLLRPRVEKLLVGTRNCTALVDGVNKQVAVVRKHLDDTVPIHGVLCFVEADWPLFGGSFTTRGSKHSGPRSFTPSSLQTADWMSTPSPRSTARSHLPWPWPRGPGRAAGRRVRGDTADGLA